MRYPCPLLRKLNSRPGSNTELPSQNEPKKTYKILLTGSVAKGPLQTQTLIKNWKTTTFSRFWNEETRILGSTWLYAFTARFAGVVEAGIEKIQPQISRINHIITFQTRSDTRTWDDENLLPVTKVFTEKKVASVDDIFFCSTFEISRHWIPTSSCGGALHFCLIRTWFRSLAYRIRVGQRLPIRLRRNGFHRFDCTSFALTSRAVNLLMTFT